MHAGVEPSRPADDAQVVGAEGASHLGPCLLHLRGAEALVPAEREHFAG
ncbi:hypothetical protein SALBM311S_10868 [Streptomyces alboniger]